MRGVKGSSPYGSTIGREARRLYERQWDAAHPERVRASKQAWKQRNRKQKYGLTNEQFLQMVEEQGGRCALCGEIPTQVKGLSVDHDHITGEVRALLCPACNVGLGHFKEDPILLQRAIAYLNRHGNLCLQVS